MLAASLMIASTACGGPSEDPDSTPEPLPSAATAHFDAVIADLDAYWPEFITEAYLSPTVIAYRQGEVPETVCAEGTDADDWSETPFYCFDDQTIVYDADFLADIYEHSNSHAATAVLAHEWAHHLQTLRDRPEATLQQELQADCLAGFFMGARYGGLSEVTEATDAMERVAEAGNERYTQSAWFDEAEHGSPGMRVIAFTMGSITGPFSFGDVGFCDGYASYRPQPPIELGEYRLAHLPGFEHRQDSAGVTVIGGGVSLRVEPLDDGVLRGADGATQQAGAAWSAYSREQSWDAYENDDIDPIVSERPHGTLTTMGYAAAAGSLTRIGFFTLHRDRTGAALIIDSAAEISSGGATTPSEDDALALAGNLGLAVENLLCTPSQSGDLSSTDYFFSCDLEHEE